MARARPHARRRARRGRDRGPGGRLDRRLAELPKVGPKRAERLFTAWIAAGAVYELVSLLIPAGLEARLAGRAVDTLGPPAPRLLRDDPWALLAVFGATVGDADRLARAALPGVARDDSRRARALVGYVLARQSRDGHTVAPRDLVADGLSEFGCGPADAAIEAALAARRRARGRRRHARAGAVLRGRGVGRRAPATPARHVVPDQVREGAGHRSGRDATVGRHGGAQRRRHRAHRWAGHRQEPDRRDARRAGRGGEQVGGAGRADGPCGEAARAAVRRAGDDAAPIAGCAAAAVRRRRPLRRRVHPQRGEPAGPGRRGGRRDVDARRRARGRAAVGVRRRHAPGLRRRRGPAAVDRAGTGARRPDRLGRRARSPN